MGPIDILEDTLLTQYKNSPNFIKYLSCYAEEMQDVYTTMQQCCTDRYYDVAVGKQLDVIAELVGADRLLRGIVISGQFGYLEVAESRGMGREDDKSLGGPLRSEFEDTRQDITLTDELLRNWINARIIKNNTRCNVEDTIAFFKLLLNKPELSVEVERSGDASVTITLHFKASPHEAALIKSLSQHIKPLGVEFVVQDLRGVIQTLPVPYRRELW